MKIKSLIFAASLLILPAAAQPVQEPVNTAQAQITVPPSSIKSSIDRAMRHLRSTQNKATGQYGEGIRQTATVLLAFAASPRKYRIADGPFIGDAVDFLLSKQNEAGLITDIEGQANFVNQAGLAVHAAHALLAVGAPQYLTTDAPAYVALIEAAKAAVESKEIPFERVADRFTPTSLLFDTNELILATLTRQTPSGAFVADADMPEVTTAHILGLTQAWKTARAAQVKTPFEVKVLPSITPQTRAQSIKAMARGANFLVQHAAIEPGKWGAMGQANPGITAMVIGGLASMPEPRSAAVESAIDAGATWLLSMQHEDGSIHDGQLANYVTSASIMALAKLDREELKIPIARARAFLSNLQADEGEGYKPGDRYYGGVGYGGDERPDLSNLQMAIEAMAAAGAGKDDPAMQKALKFLERTQNRRESNDTRIADAKGDIVSGNDGGAAYMPGDSKAGFVTLADGTRVPQSYGSMTFALLKSYLLAGLSKEDPRTAAAFAWIEQNYTLDMNPGFENSPDPGAAYQGLFYYFLAMSRALELFEVTTITTPDGRAHNWRTELAGRLATMQLPDGSWVNNNSPRWFEGNPTLATAYALQTLGPVIR